MRILLVEDDTAVRELLAQGLTSLHYEVLTAASGSTGLGLALTRAPDLVVLDLGLPDLDGLTVLTMLRTVTSVPVVVATGRESENQVIRGLEAGADDYVVKPFTAALLNARLNAVMRRRRGAEESDRMRVGRLEVDFRGQAAALSGRPLELRPKEFQLLAHLVTHAGRVVGWRELRTEMWGSDVLGGDKTLAVHLSSLRRHLGESAAAPRYLHTVRGVGLKLVDPAV